MTDSQSPAPVAGAVEALIAEIRDLQSRTSFAHEASEQTRTLFDRIIAALHPQPAPAGCKEQCWACAESGIGCNLLWRRAGGYDARSTLRAEICAKPLDALALTIHDRAVETRRPVMSILRAALGQLRHETLPTGSPDPFDGRFGPAQEHDAGGGRAMYRRCAHCGGMAMVGSLSPHARWCDRDRAASARHNEEHAEA